MSSRFDPYGYRTQQPLVKEVFYTDPYITCANCNFLNFVDVVMIRHMIASSEIQSIVLDGLHLKPEVLPPCRVCRRADSFMIGSHDFSVEIADRIRYMMYTLPWSFWKSMLYYDKLKYNYSSGTFVWVSIIVITYFYCISTSSSSRSSCCCSSWSTVELD